LSSNVIYLELSIKKFPEIRRKRTAAGKVSLSVVYAKRSLRMESGTLFAFSGVEGEDAL